MADDKPNNSDPSSQPGNPDDTSPSAIFAEMMRQAAARRTSSHVTPAQPEKPLADDVASDTDLPFEFYVAEKGDTVLVPDPEATSEPEPVEQIDYYAPAPEPAPYSEPPVRAAQDNPAPPITAAPVQPQIPEKTPEQQQRDEAMRQQRIQRVQRRKARRRQRRAGAVGGFMRTLLVVLLSAGLASTIFTWFTSPDLYDRDVATGLQVASATGVATIPPTPLPTPNWLKRIGIVSGHRGPENDPGAVCPDGLTEAEINFNVAQVVVRNLRSRGYTVDCWMI